jgi:hypothetical protein
MVALPLPLSLMPGPAITLSRCAPTTTTLLGSPFLVSASTFTVRRISDPVLVATCRVTVAPPRAWPTIASPRVEVLAGDDGQDLDPAAAGLSPSRQWVLAALQAGGDLQTVKQLGDRLAQGGHPLKPRTIQTTLGELEAAGLAQGSEEGNGRARYWSPTTPNPDADRAGDGGAGMA